MPPAKKIDKLPDEDRAWLADRLREYGYGQIIKVTDELNDRLDEKGYVDSIGKSAVGDFNLMLKEQAAAFEVAEKLVDSLGVDAESDLQKQLYHLISATAMQSIIDVRGEGSHLTADASAKYAKMLKDLMSSSSTREKLLEGERERVAKEAREAAHAEVEQALAETAAEEGLSSDLLKTLRNNILGLKT